MTQIKIRFFKFFSFFIFVFFVQVTHLMGSDVSTGFDDVEGDPNKVTNWISFPAGLCATGTRSFFVEAAKHKMFNVISTTCGTLDHDIARSYQTTFTELSNLMTQNLANIH